MKELDNLVLEIKRDKKKQLLKEKKENLERSKTRGNSSWDTVNSRLTDLLALNIKS